LAAATTWGGPHDTELGLLRYLMALPVSAALTAGLPFGRQRRMPTTAAERKRLRQHLHRAAPVRLRIGTTAGRRLVDAARRHALDVLNNRDVDGDIGSDGSAPQDRANATGFVGKVAETVAINPALTAPSACGRRTALDRSVVVAMYGRLHTP
jgi:hypothetical protein